MTGFGEARRQDDRWTVTVELRTVNNRHLKLNAKLSDPFGALEPDLERLVRETVRRGTVQASIRVERPRRAEDYRLNRVALASYKEQMAEIAGPGGTVDMAALLGLPGVIEERRPATDDPHEDWPALAEVVSEALGKLQAARARRRPGDGRRAARPGPDDRHHLEGIEARGPEVVSATRSGSPSGSRP